MNMMLRYALKARSSKNLIFIKNNFVNPSVPDRINNVNVIFMFYVVTSIRSRLGRDSGDLLQDHKIFHNS